MRSKMDKKKLLILIRWASMSVCREVRVGLPSEKSAAEKLTSATVASTKGSGEDRICSRVAKRVTRSRLPQSMDQTF